VGFVAREWGLLPAAAALSALAIAAPALALAAGSITDSIPFLKKEPPPLRERPPGLEGYGEKYDSVKFAECQQKFGKQDTRCEVYRLKRIPAPETWPYHDKSPMKWPDPPKEQVYKPGMGPVEYWRALCKAEAGEFIYRTVPNVTAIYQIRPRPKESEYSVSDRYVREDPYGYIDSESGTMGDVPWMYLGSGWGSRKSSGKYFTFETPILPNDRSKAAYGKYFPSTLFDPPPPGERFQRFSGYDQRSRQSATIEYSNNLVSEYGWTWRGIKRAFDRELGVAGGELAVVDLKTGEILGLRRGFILGSVEQGRRARWSGGNVCPEYFQMPGIGMMRERSKDFDFSLWFINKVLIPVGTYKD
jgi:hypothetical protein